MLIDREQLLLSGRVDFPAEQGLDLHPNGLRSALSRCRAERRAADCGTKKNAYRGHGFPLAIIRLTVWIYAGFTLRLRDVEEYHRYTTKRTSLPAAPRVLHRNGKRNAAKPCGRRLARLRKA